jgi:hypothetical protein
MDSIFSRGSSSFTAGHSISIWLATVAFKIRFCVSKTVPKLWIAVAGQVHTALRSVDAEILTGVIYFAVSLAS